MFKLIKALHKNHVKIIFNIIGEPLVLNGFIAAQASGKYCMMLHSLLSTMM